MLYLEGEITETSIPPNKAELERELTIWVETTENEINLTVTLETFKQYDFKVGDKLSIQIDKRLDIDRLTQDLLKGPQ